MISRTAHRVFRATFCSSRGICVTPKVSRFHPHVQLKSKLVSTNGLIQEKVSGNRRKDFNEQEHEPSVEYCYGTINIQIQGYDMVVVEKFAQNIHRFVQEQKITIKEVYALPPEHTTLKYIIDKFTIAPNQMSTEAELTTYTRIIQISNLASTFAPILVKSLMKDVPPGVELSIAKYTEEDFLRRHKVNKELQTAREELAVLKTMKSS